MTSQRPARRHHLVNKAYLLRFAKGTVLRRVPLAGTPHLLAVSKATVENDFYTTAAPGLEVDAYETALSGLEGKAEAAFKRVVDDGVFPPSSEDRFHISEWIGAQYIRTRAARRGGEELQRTFGRLEVGISSTQQVRERLGLPETTPDEAVEELRTGMLASADIFAVDPQMHLSQMASMIPDLAQMAMARPWALTRFERRALATSDTPVALIPDPTRPAHGTGFLTASRIVVPLSRRVALTLGTVGNPEGYPEGVLPGTTRSAQLFNDITIRNARHVLFHHPDDDPLAGFTLPDPVESEMDVDHDHIEELIRGFARQQGRASGLPTRPSESE